MRIWPLRRNIKVADDEKIEANEMIYRDLKSKSKIQLKTINSKWL